MSEADLPNNSPLDPNFLPEAQPFEQEPADKIQEEARSEELSSEELPLDSTEEGNISETDWFTLTSKLRKRNRSLLKKVSQLEQTLAHSQEALQAQEIRAIGSNNLLTQQMEEFQATQEQLARLFQELESSHQTSQRQQILIETLSEQLEASQERISQLEGECSLLQESYQQKSQQLKQKEQKIQELNSRLQRQQRRTLQFKAALDKCLDVSNIRQPEDDTLINQTQELTQSIFPKAKPIQPWSAQLEQWEDLEETAEWFNNNAEQVNPQKNLVPFSSSIIELEEKELEAYPAETEDYWQEELESERDQDQEIASGDMLQVDDSEGETALKEENDEGLYAPYNWPSPILYPLRPHKKRKSFAAIELPNFPPYQS